VRSTRDFRSAKRARSPQDRRGYDLGFRVARIPSAGSATPAVSPAKAQTLLPTFNDPTVTSKDGFGDAVAIDGNNVLIGATGHDINGRTVGQAHLFDATTGNLLQTFNDPIVTTWTRGIFGHSVALDGNNVLIGAPGDNTNGKGVGQAHLFTVPEPRQEDGISSGHVYVEGNAMWNNRVYISWQNRKHVNRPDSKNMVIDIWKVDDNGDGDPRNDENRIQQNHSDCANGIYAIMGYLGGHNSGVASATTRHSDGSVALILSNASDQGTIEATYTIKPNDSNIYGELKLAPLVNTTFAWMVYQIGGVWVSQGPGNLTIYDHVYLDSVLHPTEADVQDRSYYWEITPERGDCAALKSTTKRWATGMVFLDASVPPVLRATLMTYQYNYPRCVSLSVRGRIAGGQDIPLIRDLSRGSGFVVAGLQASVWSRAASTADSTNIGA